MQHACAELLMNSDHKPQTRSVWHCLLFTPLQRPYIEWDRTVADRPWALATVRKTSINTLDSSVMRSPVDTSPPSPSLTYIITIQDMVLAQILNSHSRTFQELPRTTFTIFKENCTNPQQQRLRRLSLHSAILHIMYDYRALDVQTGVIKNSLPNVYGKK